MKNEKTFKLLTFSAFLLLIVLSTFIYTSYVNITNVKTIYESDRQAKQEEIWNYVEDDLKENQQKATIQADQIRDNIDKDICNEYKDKFDLLKKDMDSVQPGADNPFLRILYNNTNGKYLNTVSDANDAFVIAKWIEGEGDVPKGAIIADSSLDCLVQDKLKTYNVEIGLHYNKELALEALTKINNQETKEIVFWEYKTPANANHKKITSMNLDELKEVFMSEGLEGLKTYEILNASYLASDKDIFNTNDVDYTGNAVDNYKIIIVQGFNLYDALIVNHGDYIKDAYQSVNILEKNYLHQVQVMEVETILCCILVFVAFFSIAKMQNVYVAELGK